MENWSDPRGLWSSHGTRTVECAYLKGTMRRIRPVKNVKIKEISHLKMHGNDSVLFSAFCFFGRRSFIRNHSHMELTLQLYPPFRSCICVTCARYIGCTYDPFHVIKLTSAMQANVLCCATGQRCNDSSALLFERSFGWMAWLSLSILCNELQRRFLNKKKVFGAFGLWYLVNAVTEFQPESLATSNFFW